MFSKEAVVFFLSSVLTLTLIYYRVPIKTLQQIIALFLVGMLIILNRFIVKRANSTIATLSHVVLLFLAAVIVQLIVLSSGGFFSPFLILLHLFTLGSSFLLNLQASVSFLVFALMALIASVWFNPEFLTLFKSDPFSVALYVISFIVIIPLVQLLNRTYNVKDTLYKILSENLQIGKLREKSILQGLSELILITDGDLKILSVNQAVEILVKLSSEQISGKSLLETISLKYKDGTKGSKDNLSINQVIKDHAARIIKDFFLAGEDGSTPVTIQVRPIVDLQGKVSQFVFVIKEGSIPSEYSLMHGDLDQAQKKSQMVFEDFKNRLSQAKIPLNLRIEAEFLRKMEEDLFIARELEDHIIKENIKLFDIAEICQQTVLKLSDLAKYLNVSLEFILPSEELSEKALLNLKQKQVSDATLSISDFSVLIDPKWFFILIEKLLEIAILLSFGERERKVQVSLSKENNVINVNVGLSYPVLAEQARAQLLVKYYDQMGIKTNLRLGSGLEGFIAQRISTDLNIELEVKSEYYPSRLTFNLKLSKNRAKLSLT